MRKLVVYYSLEGNTRFAGRIVAGTIGADLLELRPSKDLDPRGAMKYILGGRQVVRKIKPELLPFDRKAEDYDLLFIGTPVWAFSYAPALASFFSAVKLRDKKIALFCCHGGSKGKTLEKMKRQLAGNEIIGQFDLKEPLKLGQEEAAEKLRIWAAEILKKAAD